MLTLTLLIVMAATLGETHERTEGIEPNLIKLYDAWGKPEEADKYRQATAEPRPTP